jgi:hypothetical protein
MARITKAQQAAIDARKKEIQEFKENWSNEFLKFVDKLNFVKERRSGSFYHYLDNIHGVTCVKILDTLYNSDYCFPVFAENFIGFIEINEFYDAQKAIDDTIYSIDEEIRKEEAKKKALAKLKDSLTKEELELLQIKV